MFMKKSWQGNEWMCVADQLLLVVTALANKQLWWTQLLSHYQSCQYYKSFVLQTLVFRSWGRRQQSSNPQPVILSGVPCANALQPVVRQLHDVQCNVCTQALIVKLHQTCQSMQHALPLLMWAPSVDMWRKLKIINEAEPHLDWLFCKHFTKNLIHSCNKHDHKIWYWKWAKASKSSHLQKIVKK